MRKTENVSVVRDATWTNKRGITHIIQWGATRRTNVPGWFVVCCEITLGIIDDSDDRTPTCVYCVVRK